MLLRMGCLRPGSLVRKGLLGFLKLGSPGTSPKQEQPLRTLDPGRPNDFRVQNSYIFGKVMNAIGNLMK